MELCVDLKEITRIPYHELETVYFSINFTVLPYGKRCLTGPSNGEKSIKFRPHRFKFFIEDVENSQLSLTVLSHLTDNRFFILSYLKIPLISVPINGFATKSFETEPLHPISIPPIVKLTIGINIDYSIEKSLKHPNIIDTIEYDKYESPPILQLDCFEKLRPPKHYLDKCSKLAGQNPNLFINLIYNDKLRKYVLDKASEYYKNIEDISYLFEIDKKKKKEISSFSQKEFNADTKKVKFKKDLENGANSNNQKNRIDRLQQPSIEPKISRVEDQKIDISLSSEIHNQSICKNKANNDLNNEIMTSINTTCNSIGIDVRSFSLNPNIRSKIQTKNLSNSVIGRTDSESTPQYYYVNDSPTTITQNSQFQKSPQQTKHQMAPQQPKIKLQLQQPQKYQQQTQQQQSQKSRPETSQQPQQKLQQQQQQIQPQPKSQPSPAKPLQLPNQPQTKQSQPTSPHHPPQSSNHQIQPQPSTADKVIKKMFVNIDKNQTGMQMKRGLFPDKRNQMPAKKPKPPTPNQYPALVDSNNPRRKQISEF